MSEFQEFGYEEGDEVFKDEEGDEVFKDEEGDEVYGNKEDYDTFWKDAVEEYRKMAEKGDAEAQWRLACCYLEGRGGLPVDYIKARELFQKSVAQGNTEAQLAWANCDIVGCIEHLKGVDKKKDEKNRLLLNLLEREGEVLGRRRPARKRKGNPD